MKDSLRRAGDRGLWAPLPGPIGLVSASPRRAALLEQVRLPFVVVPPRHEEEAPEAAEPEALVTLLAERKVRAVEGERGVPDLLLGADTVVVQEGRILGKPRSAAEAREMLSSLSGREHWVISGVFALHRGTGRGVAGTERTKVLFRGLEEREIADYVATGEPMDKAGAYGIQGVGALLVERIEGCYSNVVGLPLMRTMGVLHGVLSRE